jgi:exopolysaccharide biosynthesis polyprenyl glycosylphosphotransferase
LIFPSFTHLGDFRAETSDVDRGELDSWYQRVAGAAPFDVAAHRREPASGSTLRPVIIDVADVVRTPTGDHFMTITTGRLGSADTEPRLLESVPAGPGLVAGPSAAGKHRGWGQRFATRIMVTDLIALVWAAAGVYLVSAQTGSGIADDPTYLPYLALTVALVAMWMLALHLSGSRDPKAIGYGPVEYKRIIHATFAVFGLMAIVSYLFQLDLPRSYLLVMMPAGLIGLTGSRFIWRRWLHRQRKAGRFHSKVLAVGNQQTVSELVRDLRRAPAAGYSVVGVCISQGRRKEDRYREPVHQIDGVPVLGGLDDIAAIVRSSGADTVAITSSSAFGPSQVNALSWELEDTDAELILAPALTNIAGPRVHTQPVAGLPLIHVDRPTYRGANRILKKSFDVVGSALLLVLFSPVLIGFAAAIKLTSKGPVFFRQNRVGINGESFRMIKFRSMVVDAEARLAALQEAERDAGNAVLFKMKNDPRITPVGRFIRRFSIDELPQLFNVLLGNMSLVGPRPPLKAGSTCTVTRRAAGYWSSLG